MYRISLGIFFAALGVISAQSAYAQNNNCDLPSMPIQPGVYYIASGISDNRYVDKKSQDDQTIQFYWLRPGSLTQLFEFANIDRGCYTIRVVGAPGQRYLAMASSRIGMFGPDREVIARDINEQEGPLLERYTVPEDQLNRHWRVLPVGNNRYAIQLIHRGTAVKYNGVVGGAHLPGGPVVVEGCLERRNPDDQGRAVVSTRCTGIVEQQFFIQSRAEIEHLPTPPGPPPPPPPHFNVIPLSDSQMPDPVWVGFAKSSNIDREEELRNLVGSFRRVDFDPQYRGIFQFRELCQRISKQCVDVLDWQGHRLGRDACESAPDNDGSRLGLCQAGAPDPNVPQPKPFGYWNVIPLPDAQSTGKEWVGFAKASNKDRETELHRSVGDFRRVDFDPIYRGLQTFTALCQRVSKRCTDVIDWEGKRLGSQSCNVDKADGSRLALCEGP